MTSKFLGFLFWNVLNSILDKCISVNVLNPDNRHTDINIFRCL